jgi:GABA(A) receptor-associated protein
MTSFKEKYDFSKRKMQVDRITEKYPTRIPLIVEKNKKSSVPDLDKGKFLVPSDLTVGQFLHIVRKRINLTSEQALFIFIKNTIPPTSAPLNSLYEKYKDEDGFLYITYSGENTFGSL